MLGSELLVLVVEYDPTMLRFIRHALEVYELAFDPERQTGEKYKVEW